MAGSLPIAQPMTLGEILARLTVEGELYEKLPDNRLRCYACGHRCLIPEGRPGVCKVRFNEAGILKVPAGYVGALQVDPVEKKPFFHALPGSLALSFGMLGCDYHCGYCQNWITSQALRDPAAQSPPHPVGPEELAEMALDSESAFVVSTYNEPLITSEWAVAVFKAARARGLKTAYVSNGNGTEEVLEYIRPWVDCYKVDLKGFNDPNYRKLGGKLETVLDTVRMLRAKGFWLEVVTLLVPGFNDAEAEIRDIARFLASVSPEIPWHVTAFHQDYKMRDRENTAVRTLLKAAEIGATEGLQFVYAGNLPGRVGQWEDTRCPGCGLVL
ncbi:MAG TPA: AmmeMemoRadiSam system radical SAM enzyme, partial [Candidatus Methylomirabilis sp.]|nr:AmmeMemoRadiSam system radical SAM enzyme [Candidatus Methylomirabilis sp.]